MARPAVTPAAGAAAAARTSRPWLDSARAGEVTTSSSGHTSSGLGTSLFDRLADAPRPVVVSPFDVCHVGVVLRAVILMQAAVALGAGFAAASPSQWLMLYSSGAAIALTGTLLWLASACALQRVLARAADAAQVAAAAALGAASALVGWVLYALAGAGDIAPMHLLPPAASGAALGAATAYWLKLRNRTALPADTTARLAELQSRIRPHFLFNTLNTAMALVRVDPRRAEDILADLAELFRVALSSGGESVPLAEEIDLAQRYLAIEQARFGQRLAVTWELDEAADRARVPPLLLQPLLENAVRHGIEPAADGGSIRVRTRMRRGHAVLTIVNSLPQRPSQPGHGMALRNVRERLHLMHDVAAQFDARRDGESFRVQIVLPA
jgi:two-component system sensor histidine kinase AlgZ